MARARRHNPFDPARPPEASFVGRKDLLRQLTGGLREGKSYALVGPVGIGKTTLAQELGRRIAECSRRKDLPRPLPVYVACQREDERVESILGRIADAVAEGLKRQYGRECPEPVRRQAQSHAQDKRLEPALAALSAWAFDQDRSTYRIVLLLDALHRVSGKSSLTDLAAILYGLVNGQSVPTSLLLVSRRSVSEELRSDVSRLRDLLTREIVLGPLDLPETRALAAMAKTHGWTVEEGIADEVHRLTGGHPYRLQYYLQAALADSGKLTAIAVRAVDTPATIEHLDRLLGPRGAAPADRATIFVSYSHKDEAQKEQLMTHLGVLGSAGAAKAWVDDQIGAGEDWRRQILEAIDGAKVAVLLVSASFLNSPFILDVEIPRIRQRRHEGGLQVVPIIASDCAWQKIDWLAEMNVKPKNGSPVWREGGIHADKELSEIVHQIATLLAAGGIR